MPEAAARPWINPAGLPPEPHQIDDERYRSSEVLRRIVAGMPRLDMRHNTFTKIVRQRMQHDKSPPHALNHLQPDL